MEDLAPAIDRRGGEDAGGRAMFERKPKVSAACSQPKSERRFLVVR